MSGVPVETVVELVVSMSQKRVFDGITYRWIDIPEGPSITATTFSELRDQVREYVLSLVGE